VIRIGRRSGRGAMAFVGGRAVEFVAVVEVCWRIAGCLMSGGVVRELERYNLATQSPVFIHFVIEINALKKKTTNLFKPSNIRRNINVCNELIASFFLSRKLEYFM